MNLVIQYNKFFDLDSDSRKKEKEKEKEIKKLEILKHIVEEHNQNLDNEFMLRLKIARRWNA